MSLDAEQAVNGEMTVDIRNAKSITGHGTLNSDSAGQIWFDYSSGKYPSKIDWKNATNLTFKPGLGKTRQFSHPPAEYFFQSGWKGPRLILQRAPRR